MSPNVPPDGSPDLSPAQERAIEILVAGKPATVAAKEAGVDRRTLHRWRTDDPRFIAALNARRMELREAGRARLLGLINKAVEVVENRLYNGDVATALHVLNGLRVIGPKADDDPTETDANVIAGEIRERKLFAQLKASL